MHTWESSDINMNIIGVEIDYKRKMSHPVKMILSKRESDDGARLLIGNEDKTIAIRISDVEKVIYGKGQELDTDT